MSGIAKCDKIQGLQSASGITKSVSYYKVGRNTVPAKNNDQKEYVKCSYKI